MPPALALSFCTALEMSGKEVRVYVLAILAVILVWLVPDD